MKTRLLNFIKNNQAITRVVWSCVRLGLQTLHIFVPTREKVILFNSFSGRKIDGSPLALYKEICRREEFDDWDLVWIVDDPTKFTLPRGRYVIIDSFEYLKAFCYSRVWISNMEMTRGAEFRPKEVIEINTDHGFPIKLSGADSKMLLGGHHKSHSKIDPTRFICCAQSNYDKEIYKRINGFPEESFLMCDLPCNDSLFTYSLEDVNSIKGKLGIDKSKKVILYAPTFREYSVDSNGLIACAPPINLKKWEAELGDRYVLLVRAHHAVQTALEITENNFIKNVSTYPIINDLYVISDALISDYSGAFGEFAILDRPMFCFAYDLEEYREKRGLYEDVFSDLPCNINRTEDDLLKEISNCNLKQYSEKTKQFHNKYMPNAGHASVAVVDELIRKLFKDE